jgi:hypothetical protein
VDLSVQPLTRLALGLAIVKPETVVAGAASHSNFAVRLEE